MQRKDKASSSETDKDTFSEKPKYVGFDRDCCIRRRHKQQAQHVTTTAPHNTPCALRPALISEFRVTPTSASEMGVTSGAVGEDVAARSAGDLLLAFAGGFSARAAEKTR